ncbi:phage tail protein [Paludibacterium paludis]|uniref:Tail Collar domain-containing protein n=1 Tax=Paludibacterium paludis TaxID=1225769 RepID=A0A918P696_9NEIS|nr:tail fiber protein [Paludibacterium paludis]GGY24781.1 tail Collar domain-containing protein [Paludibacterium paludis]
MEAYMGTITIFAFNYAPQDWAMCQGQTYQVSQYQALFSLLGTLYGGNGSQNFMLPNLTARMPIGTGPAQPAFNLPAYNPGQNGGQQSASLSIANLPVHTHTSSAMQVAFQAAGTPTPTTPASAPSAANPYLGASGAGTGLATIWSTALNNPVAVKGLSVSGATDATGGNTPVSVLNPFLALNFCIAINGLYPVRP